MSAATVPRPEWLIVGARVICWTTGPTSTGPGYAIGTVSKIHRVTFAVDVVTGRGPVRRDVGFPIEGNGDGDHARTETGTYPNTRHCAARTSTIGQLQRAKMREDVAVGRVTNAVTVWRNAPRNRAAIRAALRALETLQRELDGGPTDD